MYGNDIMANSDGTIKGLKGIGGAIGSAIPNNAKAGISAMIDPTDMKNLVGLYLLTSGNKMLALGQYVEQCSLNDSDPKNKVIIVNECTIHTNDSTKIYNYKSPKSNIKSIPLLHKSSDIGSAEYVFNSQKPIKRNTQLNNRF